MDEHTPLIHTPRTTPRRFKYRFKFIRSKGAVLVIIIDALIKWFLLYIIYTAAVIKSMEFNNLVIHGNFFVVDISMLFFPIIGLIADMCVGRYRMILSSMLFSLVMWIVSVIVVILYIETHSVLFDTISLIVLGASFIGVAGIVSIIFPFNIDQLMGASGDELSTTIYWHSFTGIIPLIVYGILYFYLSLYINVRTLLMIFLSIGGTFLVLALSILFIFNDWLDKTPQFYNPIKLIFQVLNYARKNKYPRNRSALTYWENSVPTRLDLGKDKYGGPFTVEQVEDVKTVFRLLPVLISQFASGFCYIDDLNHAALIDRFVFHVGKYILFVVLILIHLFILYPCCSKYIPSMLKRITLGLVFGFLTPIVCVITKLIFNIALYSGAYQWLIIIPMMTYSITLFLIEITSLEFIVAQSPKSMRVAMVGLWYASVGFGDLSRVFVAYLVHKIIGNLNNADAALYANIVDSVILLLILIMFVIFAKCYKLRIRENIVPVALIAEEHYERYQEQSDKYRRDRELSYTDSY